MFKIKEKSNGKFNSYNIFFFTMAAFCFSVFILITLGFNGNPSREYSLEKIEEYEITKNVNGNSIDLFSKNGVSYYTFLAKNADDEYDTLSVNSKNVKIIHISETETEKVIKFKRKFTFSDKIKLLLARSESKYEYKFYIKP